MTRAEVREFLATGDARYARARCGIRAVTVATVLGVHRKDIHRYESGERVPKGSRGGAYCRIVAAFIRHLEVNGG